MDITITPAPLRGTVEAQPSKSAAHRAAICAMLAKGISRLSPIVKTRDMVATASAAQALGALTEISRDCLSITGIAAPPERASIDCDESGSTLRFFIPIVASLGVRAAFEGRGQLPNRPLDPLLRQLNAHGVETAKNGGEILTISGHLQSGRYEIAGNVSSQYITGLLFALPLLPGDSEIVLTTPLASKGYVDMTLAMLEQFGVTVEAFPGGWRVPGNQQYRSRNITVEGDYSGAAFWLCAGAIGGPLAVTGLDPRSTQGDRAIVPILERMGAIVESRGNSVTVSPGQLKAVDVDVEDIPDLMPVLAATACFAKGVTRLYNAGRLRLKECDRLAAMTQGLAALGANVEQKDDQLLITGGIPLTGGAVSSYDDHRIAMALSVAAIGCKGPVTVHSAGCVDKSYPAFFKDYENLGGRCHVV